jgi:hypothetical protein
MGVKSILILIIVILILVGIASSQFYTKTINNGKKLLIGGNKTVIMHDLKQATNAPFNKNFVNFQTMKKETKASELLKLYPQINLIRYYSPTDKKYYNYIPRGGMDFNITPGMVYEIYVRHDISLSYEQPS